MAKQRIIEGAILEINIQGEYFSYAQILSRGLGYAFFDFKSNERLKDVKILLNSNVLFILMVYNDIINDGVWTKVGKLPLRNDLLIQPMKFIQDPLEPSRFEIYNPNTGEIRRATKKECEGLERAAVWEAIHVEEKIRDYFLGVPNFWTKKLKIRGDYFSGN